MIVNWIKTFYRRINKHGKKMYDSEFSNWDQDVFIINLKEQIDRGALMSRYSRTKELDLRKLWLKEFKDNPERGKNFYERVFVEYGDESIAELVTAQVGIQNVSNIVSKIIEDNRIGLSYIEKSSRYVPYDEKVNGRFLYIEGEKIGLGGELLRIYNEACDYLFETYSILLKKLLEKLKKIYPIETLEFEIDGKGMGLKEIEIENADVLVKAYNNAIRSRALDEARYLLPAATLTNVGVSGNARSYIRLMNRLLSSELKEARSLGEKLKKELYPVFSKLMDSMEKDYGKQMIEYESIYNVMDVKLLLEDKKSTGKELVKLINYPDDEDAVANFILPYVFQRAGYFGADVKELIKTGKINHREIIGKISEIRKNRRNKIGREGEFANYTFMVSTNFGAFRELHRHRTMTIIRGKLTTEYGYQVPPTIMNDEEMLSLFNDAVKRTEEVYRKIRDFNKDISQYLVTFAHTYPVLINANLREIVYLTELRSTPQAHFDLRNISIELKEKITRVNPSLSPLFKFVDTGNYPLGRLRAEIRKEKKISELERSKKNSYEIA